MPQKVAQRARRRDSAHGLTRRKLDELAEVARRFQTARVVFAREYAAPRFVDRILRSSHRLVEARRSAGWGPTGLGPHQSKVALESAIGVLRSNWLTTIARVRSLIGRNPHLTATEKRWCWYVLRWPRLLRACLEGEGVSIDEDWAHPLDQAALSRHVRRLVRRYRTPLPSPGRPRGGSKSTRTSTGSSRDQRTSAFGARGSASLASFPGDGYAFRSRVAV
jgi:hypothetical protein